MIYCGRAALQRRVRGLEEVSALALVLCKAAGKKFFRPIPHPDRRNGGRVLAGAVPGPRLSPLGALVIEIEVGLLLRLDQAMLLGLVPPSFARPERRARCSPPRLCRFPVGV